MGSVCNLDIVPGQDFLPLCGTVLRKLARRHFKLDNAVSVFIDENSAGSRGIVERSCYYIRAETSVCRRVERVSDEWSAPRFGRPFITKSVGALQIEQRHELTAETDFPANPPVDAGEPVGRSIFRRGLAIDSNILSLGVDGLIN